MKSLLYVVLFSLVILSCGDSVEFVKHYNKEYNFTIEYPLKWTLKESSGLEVMSIKNPKPKDSFQETVTIEAREAPENLSPGAFGSAIYENLAKSGENFEEIENKTVIIDDKTTIYLNFKLTKDDKYLQYLVYIFKVNENNFVIVCEGLQKNFEIQSKIFKKIVNSIHFEESK